MSIPCLSLVLAATVLKQMQIISQNGLDHAAFIPLIVSNLLQTMNVSARSRLMPNWICVSTTSRACSHACSLFAWQAIVQVVRDIRMTFRHPQSQVRTQAEFGTRNSAPTLMHILMRVVPANDSEAVSHSVSDRAWTAACGVAGDREPLLPARRGRPAPGVHQTVQSAAA